MAQGDRSVFEQPDAGTVTHDEPPPGLRNLDSGGGGFFGHPKGLSTLFFTEMWERFSYYGIRPLLVLFMTAALANGGFGFDRPTASSIVGIYAASVYLASLPGGWVADRIFGLRRSIWYGAILIALGHLSIGLSAIFAKSAFFLGLILIVLGTGLLKPNISAIVGDLYPEGGSRRDAGFSIFYMGINLGALIAPLVTGTLGERVGWHWGFGGAGVGMLIGLIFFRLRENSTLGSIGLSPTSTPEEHSAATKKLAIGMGLLIVIVALAALGVMPVNPVWLASRTSYAMLTLAILYFAYLFFAGGLTGDEKKRVGVIIVLFFFSIVFWAAFEQAPTSLNLFAADYTDRRIGGWEMPVLWLQAANSFFVILFAPVFAAIWTALGKRGKDPSHPAKFSFALASAGIGFLLMVFAANRVLATSGGRVSPMWLVASYFFQSVGELALSPVGLSAMTQLAPRKFSGQMMGVWFMSIAMGNLIAGIVGGEVDPEKLDQMPALFQRTTTSLFVAAVVCAALVIPVKRMMASTRKAA